MSHMLTLLRDVQRLHVPRPTTGTTLPTAAQAEGLLRYCLDLLQGLFLSWTLLKVDRLPSHPVFVPELCSWVGNVLLPGAEEAQQSLA